MKLIRDMTEPELETAIAEEDYKTCQSQLQITLELVEKMTVGKKNLDERVDGFLEKHLPDAERKLAAFDDLLAIARQLAEKHQQGMVCTYCNSIQNAGVMAHNPGCAVARFWTFLEDCQ